MADLADVYFIFANEFGWLPRDVNNLTVYQTTYFLEQLKNRYDRMNGRSGGRRDDSEPDEDQAAYADYALGELKKMGVDT